MVYQFFSKIIQGSGSLVSRVTKFSSLAVGVANARYQTPARLEEAPLPQFLEEADKQRLHSTKVSQILLTHPGVKDIERSWVLQVNRNSNNLWKDLPQLAESLYKHLDDHEQFMQAFLKLEEFPKPLERNLELACKHIEMVHGKNEANKLKTQLNNYKKEHQHHHPLSVCL